jgi:hypothetical protein
MNEKSNRYALAALNDRRVTLAAEIVQHQSKLRHRNELLVHVDATLLLLDPSIDIGKIKAKNPPHRIKLFRHSH